MENQIQLFIDHCNNNDLQKAKEIYDPAIININTITYDTYTSNIQGPYNIFECMCIKNNLEIGDKRFGKFNYSSYLYCIRKRDNNNN